MEKAYSFKIMVLNTMEIGKIIINMDSVNLKNLMNMEMKLDIMKERLKMIKKMIKDHIIFTKANKIKLLKLYKYKVMIIQLIVNIFGRNLLIIKKETQNSNIIQANEKIT